MVVRWGDVSILVPLHSNLIQAIANTPERYGYLPLALEARILLARTSGPSGDQRRLLNALAADALTHGWKQLAAEAHNA